MAAKLFTSDSQTPAYALAFVPHNFDGKQLFAEFIGGEESSAANAHGEELSAAFASPPFNPARQLFLR